MDEASQHIRTSPGSQPLPGSGERHYFRNLLVAGLNVALSRGAITPDPAQAVVEGFAIDRVGSRTSVVSWAGAEHGEARLTVWFGYDQSWVSKGLIGIQAHEPQSLSSPLPKVSRDQFPGLITAAASGWVERRFGFYIQGHGLSGIFARYHSRHALPLLRALPRFEPQGFDVEGRYYL